MRLCPPQVRPSLLQQSHILHVTHLFCKIKRCVVCIVTWMYTSTTNQQLVKNIWIGPNRGKMHGGVADVISPLKELMVELVTLKDFANSP